MKKIIENIYFRWVCKASCLILIVFASNYYFQLCQNNFSWDLAYKFTFEWHTEKFFLGCFVLLWVALFLIGLAGSWWSGLFFYSVVTVVLGFANYQKMSYRMEPIYPDDLKMVTEFSLMKEMVGTAFFLLLLGLILVGIGLFGYGIYKSLKLNRNWQIARVSLLFVSIMMLFYVGQFNNPNNLLRKAYNRTALWIPYSQKMNYYNTGFMGGFLFNLKVEAMEKPGNYSEAAVKELVTKYKAKAKANNQALPDGKEMPNIIYIMSESFSNPDRLTKVQVQGTPLAAYAEIAQETYSGQMLSQNYGGGTANIEFEALTGLSMEPLNAQMTTPYTMLVPKIAELPSLVSLLKNQKYDATAIHPYNTSMYKRKNVYNVLGFDQFLDEETMENRKMIENNPYISDKSAFQEVTDILKKNPKTPQFIHLVTMQTHMPYGNKYGRSNYSVNNVENRKVIEDYLQDVAYTSEALQDFLISLDQLPNRTLVVFWGDHLPSIYGDDVLKSNQESTLHQTEFLFYDNRHQLSSEPNSESVVISPVYFAPTLFQKASLKSTGFYQLLLALQGELPAFEKGFYLQAGQWHEKLTLNQQAEKMYQDYLLLQYDLVSGKQYSLKLGMFE